MAPRLFQGADAAIMLADDGLAPRWLGRVSVGAMLGFAAALFVYGLVRTLRRPVATG